LFGLLWGYGFPVLSCSVLYIKIVILLCLGQIYTPTLLYIYLYIYIPISPKTAVSIPALIETALLYVHWQEQSADGETEYYMEKIMQSFLSEEHRVADMRAVMNHRTSQGPSSRSRGS
jgi:hypothetical protein